MSHQDNEPYWLNVFNLQYHMKRYAEMIVKLMKSENLYASQGGPIILSQVYFPFFSPFMYVSFEVSHYY